ncbi:MAG: TonB family protein [Terasakiella sp.]|uniref:energy transducer TonB n=1 Tax=unclassified Terasakiella TaxID=2614952 RepID=UPI003B0009FD
MMAVATSPSFMAHEFRLPFASFLALLGHVLVLGALYFIPKPEIQAPVPLSGFEMVELPSPTVMPQPVVPELAPVDQPLEMPPEPEKTVAVEPEVPDEIVVEKNIEKVTEPIARVKVMVLKKPNPPKVARPPQKPVQQPVVKKYPVKIQKVSAPALSYIPPNAHVSYLRNPKPFYPRMARKRGMEGIVLLSVSVSAKGLVSALSIKKSSGFALLDNAAKETVKKWKFQPAQKGLKAVNAVVDVPIRFSLNAK